MAKTLARERVRISVRGVVQGVGFRPFVYQLAIKNGLHGWVCNTSEDVAIEVEGRPGAIRRFLRGLREDHPPRAVIDDLVVTNLSPESLEDRAGFEIRNSLAQEGRYQLISPDIATCNDCVREVTSPRDRRYRYPFTNCTACGPRFTIIEDMPYDRPRTTMRHFQMCPDCRREYEDPVNRRFHAQPNACPVCGPKLELVGPDGDAVITGDPLAVAGRLLTEGKIVAIKGLGGFLLACDATSPAAVERLRQRKVRPSKPFAVMTASLEEAGQYCFVTPAEADLLVSPAAPIVLLRRRPGSLIVAGVAPNLNYLGVMLPYTPLHHLLLREVGRPLVMTSGNLSEEPIAKDNDEALRRLSGIADYFLVHNRDVYARYDDSVAIVEREKPQLIRRARGYAPYPIRLGFKSRPVLACGAEEKNTFCLTRDAYAFLSQHIGDMENLETLDHFTSTIALYQKLFNIGPELIAHDLHPDYLSTKYARDAARARDIGVVEVQHHHAHIVSCMVDNAVQAPVIGVAFDGTGYGADGHIWGGEMMVADYRGFSRAGHIEYLPLPGGALAVKKPYRTAVGYVLTLLGEPALRECATLTGTVSETEIDMIRRQIERKVNSPLTSSCGRLFDAVSALVGIRSVIDYEAQAAIELEMAASDDAGETAEYPFSISEDRGVSVVRLAGLFDALIGDIRSNVGRAQVSARFHNTVARMVFDLCQAVSRTHGIRRVALSGGVFQNRLLLQKTVGRLEAAGFTVYTHRQVPTNDGGISLGQAVVANFAEVGS